MEGVFALFFGFIIMALVIFGLAIGYKQRAYLSKWLQAPYFASEDRELLLKRRIEDATAELEAIEKAKAETQGE